MEMEADAQSASATAHGGAHASPAALNSVDDAAGVAADPVDWKTIARRERKRAQRQELLRGMSADARRQFLESESDDKTRQAERMQRAYEESNRSRCVTLAVDLRYDSIMNDKELKSLSKQLKFVYGSVKLMRAPFQLRLFHCSAPLRESLARFSADRWLVHWHDRDELTDVVPAQDIVYLSPDSPNVLDSLDASKMYVIGGIVDKSRKKGATLLTAEGAGITTARLPIQEHITERLDHILNVNTVADVLIHFHTHGDWRRALTEVLPLRKQSSVGRRSIKRQQQRAVELDTDKDSFEEEVDDSTGGTVAAAEEDETATRHAGDSSSAAGDVAEPASDALDLGEADASIGDAAEVTETTAGEISHAHSDIEDAFDSMVITLG